MYGRYPRLLSTCGVKFFLVPFGRAHQNRLAAFLASQDGWYRRHVFAPHFAGPYVPRGFEPRSFRRCRYRSSLRR